MARGEETIPLGQNYNTDFSFSSLDEYPDVYEKKEMKAGKWRLIWGLDFGVT
jgi:hypothetical protein